MVCAALEQSRAAAAVGNAGFLPATVLLTASSLLAAAVCNSWDTASTDQKLTSAGLSGRLNLSLFYRTDSVCLVRQRWAHETMAETGEQ
jgi:hypothetical protein